MCTHSGVLATCQLEAGEVALTVCGKRPWWGRESSWAYFTPLPRPPPPLMRRTSKTYTQGKCRQRGGGSPWRGSQPGMGGGAANESSDSQDLPVRTMAVEAIRRWKSTAASKGT